MFKVLIVLSHVSGRMESHIIVYQQRPEAMEVIVRLNNLISNGVRYTATPLFSLDFGSEA